MRPGHPGVEQPAQLTWSPREPYWGRNPAIRCRTIATRDGILRAVDAGFTHFVLGLPSPFPVGVATWVADELIAPAGV
jgi:hypothetical protein